MDRLARDRGYFGRPDVMALAPDGTRIQIDFKNFAKGTSELGSGDKTQLGGKIQALLRTSGDDRALVKQELGRMQYRIRGVERDYPVLREHIHRQVALWLEAHGGRDFMDLANQVVVIFENRSVPF